MTTAQPARPAQDTADTPAPYAAVARALAPLVEAERGQKGIPALSVALVAAGRVVWAHGFGWADSAAGARATAATVYRVGALGSLLTTAGVMQLVKRGSLVLDAPVRRAVPNFRPHNPFGGEITLRALAAGRSGLTLEPPVGHSADSTAPPVAATVASLNGTTLVHAPGTRAQHSAAAAAVLAYVLERAADEPFPEYLARTVLGPAGMTRTGFGPVPEPPADVARGTTVTPFERRFDAPIAPLGAVSSGAYSTVADLGRFVGVLVAGGATPAGGRVLDRAALDTMWTPQFAPPGAREGVGFGFAIGRLDGRRTVGLSGGAPGYAATLVAAPDDSVGVVVAASLDGATGVTGHLADAALRWMLAARAGRPPAVAAAAAETTAVLPRGRALALMGRYAGARSAVDLDEYEGRLFLTPRGVTPQGGGARTELRVPAALDAASPQAGSTLVVDDRLAYGAWAAVLADRRLTFGGDTLRREPTPGSDAVAMAEPKPAPVPAADAAEYARLAGEYGWNTNTLYVREEDGHLNAVIGAGYEYPLTRAGRDRYRFPDVGPYAGEALTFRRGADGRAVAATVGAVAYPRRPLPADDDRVSFRITPVRPPAELRRGALAATAPVEAGEFRPTDLAELRALDPTIRYDIRYATSNNFMGTPFYSSAHAFLQRPAAEAAARASGALRPLGYGLLVHDAYRPWYVTKMFWDGTPAADHVFVADPAQGSRHNRGAAVDLTLYDLRTGAPVRMASGYDETSDRAYPLYPGGTALQRWSRDLLRRAMEAQGFAVYEAEWWHFDYGDWRRYRIGTLTFEQLAARRAAGGR